MNRIAPVSLSVGLSLALIAGGGAAFAATDEEIAAALVEESLAALEVTVDDPALLDDLASGIEQAIVEEVIPPEVVEVVNDAVDAGEELVLDEVLEDNLLEQDEQWDAESAAIEEAFAQIRLEFQACREASAAGETRFGASECAQGLGFRYQIAAATVRLNAVAEKEAALEGLEGDALAAAEEELLVLRAELEAQLVRVEQKLERAKSRGEVTGALTTDIEELEAVSATGRSALVSDKARGSNGRGNAGESQSDEGSGSRPSTSEEETSTTPDGQGNSGSGNSGSGNSGSGNSGQDNSGRGNSSGQGDSGNRGNSGGQGNSGKGQQG